MRISCDKRDIQAALKMSMRAVSPRQSWIYIKASEDGIRFITNDGELSVTTAVEGNVQEQGVVAIDAKMFSDVVGKFSNGTVSMETDSNYVSVIKCGRAKFTIPGNDGENFLQPQPVKEGSGVSVPEGTLRNIIKQTLFCVAVSDNNPAMTGELMEVKDGKLKITALDGHRIAIREVGITGNYPDAKVIIPGKTMGELLKVLTDSNNPVEIFFEKFHICFSLNGARITSRLIDGDYFNIERLMADTFPIKVSVNTGEMLDCVNRASVVIRDGEKKPLKISFNDGIAEISAESAFASAKEEIELESHEGNSLLMGFNPKFIFDALNAVEDDVVTLEMINGKSPCFIRNRDAGYVYIVLPVNIGV